MMENFIADVHNANRAASCNKREKSCLKRWYLFVIRGTSFTDDEWSLLIEQNGEKRNEMIMIMKSRTVDTTHKVTYT